ncbi:recombinase family protein [Kitasatospora sp. MAP5-34]|uniref:recombinase family protein n=1 Tax=Kitasatospora sp. MAP5-34 TaxID=3035102 RepID=UPI0024746979|nr:recombinase family protein [Kitasatospora sp. MAP5-34]MDH6580034.1 site-specific DNA recombinase [Kitasatospora sp. MAP5-34]
MNVIYCRLSSDRTGARVGVDTQEKNLRRLAAKDGLSIDEVIADDDLSAYRPGRKDRPGYLRLLSLLKAGKVKHLLVVHPDRLHRDPAELESFLPLAPRLRVHTTMAAPVYDLATSWGKHALRAATNDANLETAHKGDRVGDARERQAEEGVFGGGGRRPYGYGVEVMERRTWDREAGEYRMLPVAVPYLDMARSRPDEAALIQSWARQLLSGVSMCQIVADLNRRGVPTSTGNGRWTARTVQQIITNPRISGHSTRHGEIVKAGAYDAILTEEQRLALNDRFTDPAHRCSPPGSVPRWLGSGIYRCGICDDGDTTKVRRCNGRPVYHHGGHCVRSAAEVDGFVTSVLVARMARADIAEFLTPDRPGVDTASLRDEKLTLLARRDALGVAFAKGEITSTRQLAAGTGYIDARITAIDAELAATAAVSPLDGVADSGDVAAVGKAWSAAPLGQQREILRLLATVTLTAPPQGRYGVFEPLEAVIIEWRDGGDSDA